ncbi:hypothetical protein K3495_g14073 [Podosphaera aphanis]|nr:hypothetical protein K3495_g14073 [Podosphaera aphanis]
MNSAHKFEDKLPTEDSHVGQSSIEVISIPDDSPQESNMNNQTGGKLVLPVDYGSSLRSRSVALPQLTTTATGLVGHSDESARFFPSC